MPVRAADRSYLLFIASRTPNRSTPGACLAIVASAFRSPWKWYVAWRCRMLSPGASGRTGDVLSTSYGPLSIAGGTFQTLRSSSEISLSPEFFACQGAPVGERRARCQAGCGDRPSVVIQSAARRVHRRRVLREGASSRRRSFETKSIPKENGRAMGCPGIGSGLNGSSPPGVATCALPFFSPPPRRCRASIPRGGRERLGRIGVLEY